MLPAVAGEVVAGAATSAGAQTLLAANRGALYQRELLAEAK